MLKSPKLRGRGTGLNPPNRFKPLHREPISEEPVPSSFPGTEFIPDLSRSVLSWNDSPDVGFNVGINPYRGCEHGCIYCYARPTHEYFEYSCGLDFETKIMVKMNAPELLEKQLGSSRWKPQVIALSGVTDPYQPAERHWGITKKCLQVLLKFRNPAVIITKNQLVTRDIDLLKRLTQWECIQIFVSITTLNPELSRKMEPRASLPQQRLDTVQALSEAGISVGVMVAPVIPGFTDHEIPSIIQQSSRAGAKTAGHVVLRLPFGVKGLFREWLKTHFPDEELKVINRIRSIRGGKENNSDYGTRMRGNGPYAEHIARLFKVSCQRAGLFSGTTPLSTQHFRNRSFDQMSLF